MAWPRWWIVPLTFDICHCQVHETWFEVTTADYELRPSLDGAFQLHDQPGHLVLFMPQDAEAKKVSDYMVKHTSEPGLAEKVKFRSVMFPSLESISLALFFTMKRAEMSVKAYQISFRDFQESGFLFGKVYTGFQER